MNRNDLKTGMIVQVRQGTWYVVLSNTEDGLVLLNFNGYSYCSDGFDENLCRTDSMHQFDIMLVATTSKPLNTFIGYKEGTKPTEIYGYDILWERGKSDKMEKLNKTINTLQTQLEDAKKELKEIKEGK